jgi:cytochrome c oxidase accessory protein FixG
VATLLTVALAGRVFCGWLCPHSVLLETVFRPLERLIRGKTPTETGQARWRFSAVWLGLGLISMVLACGITALFIGQAGYGWILMPDAKEHPVATGFWVISAGLILFNFAWLREQTCTIICPYGRIQSVMLDPHSLAVAYDARRGEPRGAWGTTAGNCIDCRRCVAVCPTGIDIRNGSQMECIHCAACIDACDATMARLHQPPGLIRHASVVELAGGVRRLLLPRTMLYGGALVLLTAITAWQITHREPVVASLLRTSLRPVLVDGDHGDGRTAIRQVLPLSLINCSGEDQVCSLSMSGATVILHPNPVTISAGHRLELAPAIDIPRDRFVNGMVHGVLRITRNAGTCPDLPVILRLP